MNNGFSILEILIALTISVSVLSVVITNVSDSMVFSKKISQGQSVLESIFHTVDTLKSDLTKCGMRLQESSKLFGLNIFKPTNIGFEGLMGVSNLTLLNTIEKEVDTIEVENDEYLKKNKEILIYDPDNFLFEYNKIIDIEFSSGKPLIVLKENTKNQYGENSKIIILKTVALKYYERDNILKRKVNNGYFQPLIENVTDFYFNYFPDSNTVLYRVEVGNKEQIRGYIFLSNLVR